MNFRTDEWRGVDRTSGKKHTHSDGEKKGMRSRPQSTKNQEELRKNGAKEGAYQN